MLDNQEYLIPYIRTFQIEHIPHGKLSSYDEKFDLKIHRIFRPSESNLLPTNNFQNGQLSAVDSSGTKVQSSTERYNEFHSQQSKQSAILHLPSTSRKTIIQRLTTTSAQQLTKPVRRILTLKDRLYIIDPAFRHEQYLSSSSTVIQDQHASLTPIDVRPLSSTQIPIEQFVRQTNKTDMHSSVTRVDRSLSSSFSQLIPDPIINDKQATNRISNKKTSTHFLQPSKLVTLTPMNPSSSKKSSQLRNNAAATADDDDESSNRRRYYQIGSIFTSTSTFLMHQNEVIAHATVSEPFLSDTIFIIIIATLTIIILLFCLGLFCLCRRTTKHNISPSFDGGHSYADVNGQSFAIPINNYQQQISQYDNDISSSSPSMQANSVINHSTLMNDRILLPQTVALHHTAKQKAQLSKNKLKKKRVGFCCCNNSKSKAVNARTRIKPNEM